MSGKEIVERLIKDIMSGVYSETGKLPSEATLSEAFGVSRMTLRGALEQLRRQGLVEKRNGIGSYLTKRAFRRSGLIGLVIPDYERFEFFADIALATSANPPLTTISQPVKKLAATAFKTLLARIRYPNNDPREIFLDAPLVIRSST